MLKIRLHHLLCLLHFKGQGYSPEFVEHMAAIQKRMDEEPFILISHCDDICSHCRHCQGTHCDSPKPAQYDKRIERLHRFPKRALTMEEVKPFLADLDPFLEWICQDCQWLPLCKK